MNGNIEVGSDVVIGQGAYFISTQAKLMIHDHVMFGPNVTIYTGDHATDIIGKHIIEITDADKKKQHNIYDKDIEIEAGCWIGTRAIILKGVTNRKRFSYWCWCDSNERCSAVYNLCGARLLNV